MTDICIAHGGDISEPSGGTDRIAAIAGGLQRYGHDVALIVPTPNSNLPEQLDAIEVITIDLPTHGVSTQPRRAFRISRRALKIAHRRDATIQFEHSTLAGVGTLWGASEFVLDMHDLAFRSPLYGDLPFGDAVQRFIGFLEQRAVERALEIVVVSDQMKEILTSTWDVSAEKVCVIPNGYFPDRVASYYPQKMINGRVVFLGTLHPKVDIETLVAIAELPQVDDCIVIGDGNRFEELKQRSKQVDCLKVTGRLSDENAFEYVASASIAVNPQLPSDLQATSSPVKLYYYAALGVPIVTAAGPDAAHNLARADAAVVVSPDDEFVGHVQGLLQNEERLKLLSENAQQVASTWKWKDRAETFASVYERR